MIKPTDTTIRVSTSVFNLFGKLDISGQEAVESIFILLEFWADTSTEEGRKFLLERMIALKCSIVEKSKTEENNNDS